MMVKATWGVVILLGMVGMAISCYRVVCRVTKSALVRSVVAAGFLLIGVWTVLSVQIIAERQGASGLAEYFSGITDIFIDWAKENLLGPF